MDTELHQSRITPDSEASCAAAEPAPTMHRASVVSDQPIESVTVRLVPMDDGRWFRVLNWFYDAIVPDLTGAQLKVMLGLLRHRDNVSGLTTITRAHLAAHLRQSKGTISDAIKGLLAHPLGLLAEHTPVPPASQGAFEVFPGRDFAGRLAASSLAASSASRTPVRLIEPEFGQPNSSSANRTRSHIGTRARQTSQTQFQTSSDKTAGGDDDESIAMLVKPGPRGQDRPFTPEDAREILRRTGASAAVVRTAVRNAWHLAETGKLRTWQGYIATQLRQGCSLFEQLQKADDSAGRNIERIERLCREAADHGAIDEAEAVHAWLRSLRDLREQGRAITRAEWSLSDADLWPRLVQKASRQRKEPRS